MHPLLEKNLISTKEASELSGYNSDYLARLCKSDRIRGRQIGRTWLVDKTSLEAFIRSQGERKVDRARALARAREYEYRTAQPPSEGVKRRLITLSEHITLLPESMPTLRLARSSGVLAAVLALLVLATSAYASESGVIPTIADFALTTLDEVRTGFEPIATAGFLSIQNKLDEARMAFANAGTNAQASMPRTIAIAPTVAPLEFTDPTIALAPLPHLERTQLAILSANTSPRLVSKPIDLVLVGKGIFFGIINAPHAAIALEVRMVYAVPPTAELTSRVAVDTLGTIGNTLAVLTARAPSATVALAESAQSHAIALGEGAARVFYDDEYAAAQRFVAVASSGMNLEMGAINSSGTLAYQGYEGIAALGSPASIALNTLGGFAAAPVHIAQDSVLGVLGRTSLAIGHVLPTAGAVQVASAAAAPALTTGESAALTTYTTLHGFFDSATAQLAYIFAPLPIIVLPNVPAPAVAAKPVATSTRSTTQLVVSGPTYRTYSTVVQGVSQFTLDQSLASLKSDLLTQIGAITAPIAYQGAVNQTTIQQVNMIQSLTDLILHTPKIDGAIISGSSFSGSSVSATTGNFTTLTAGTSTFTGPVDATGFTINGVPVSGVGTVTSVDASGGTTGLTFTGGPIIGSGVLTLAGKLGIANGGTGTSTAPTYGKLLVGNAAGTYDLIATSSLGIVGGSSVYTASYPIQLSANNFSLAFGTTTSNTWAGTQIFTNAPTLGALSGLLYGNAGTLATAATTTFTPSGEFTTTGTLGTLLGGSNSTLALTTNGIGLTKIAQIAANSILGNITGALGNVTAFATSTLGIALSDTTGKLAIARGGTGTSTAPSYGQLLIGDANGNYELVATSSLGIVSGGGSVTAVTGTYPIISSGGTAPAISLAFGTSTSNTWGGTQTFTSAPILGALSGLIYGNAGALATVATSTFTPSSEFSTTGTLGNLLGGTNSTLALATNQTALSKLVQISANSILGNITGALGNITAFATSTLGIALSDTTGTLAVNRGGTGQSSFTANQVHYGNFATVATSSIASGTNITVTNGSTAYVLGAQPTISLSGTIAYTNGGTGTTTAPIGQLLYGGGTAYQSVATTSETLGSEFNFSGTSLGARVGGGSGTLTLATNQTVLSKLVQVAANTILGNNTGATGNVVAFATSTLGIALSDTTGTLAVNRGGTGQTSFTANQVHYGNFATVATSSIANGTNITVTNGSSAFVLGAQPTISLSGTIAYGNGGTGTTTAAISQLLYGGASGYQSIGTTTFTPSAEFLIGGTIGAFVGGANSTLALATNGVALTKLNTIAANSILGNQTGATGNVVALATSTLSIGGTAGNITGIASVVNGGTGWGAVASNAILLGNGSGALATTSAGTNGQVLALVNGVPTWQATTTLSTISGTLGATQGGTGVTSYNVGDILYADSSNHLTTLAAAANGSVLKLAGGVPGWGVDLTSGGGGGGGTWATTTSNVAGRLINYSLNSTDIVAIGATSTTTAPFWFDPNTLTSFLSGKVGVGTTSPFARLSVSSATQLAANTPLFTVGSTTNATLFTVLAGGNVGIGSTSPASLLSITGPSGTATANAVDVLTVVGGNGFTSSAANATNGSNISLTAGSGGSATGVGHFSAGGGNITLTTGASGNAGSSLAPDAGSFIVQTGNGGTANGTSNSGGMSGSLSLSTGNGGDAYGTNGFGGAAGSFQFTGGTGGNATSSGSTGGNGGGFVISGGNGGIAPGGSSGGSFLFSGGSGGKGSAGGGFTATGGIGSTTGQGGSITLDGGTGGASGVAGNIRLGSTAGLVGVGTSSPYAQLSVSSPIQQAAGFSLFTVASTSNDTLFNILGNGFVGIGTTSPGSLLSIGNSGWNFYDNATSTKSGVGGVNILQGCFAVNGTCIGSNASSITSGTLGVANGGTGVNTFTSSQLVYGNGTNALTSVATTSETLGSEFSYSGSSLGARVGGGSGTLTLATNQTALSKLVQVAANTILGNNTGATGNVTAFATSTLGIALSDTTGTLAIARGGTNAASQVTNGVNYFDGTSITSGSNFNYNGTSIGLGTSTPGGLLAISNNLNTPYGTPLFMIGSTTGGTSTTTIFSVLTRTPGTGTDNPQITIGTAGLSNAAAGSLSVINNSGNSGTLSAGTLQAANFNSNSSGSGVTIASTNKSSSTNIFGTSLSSATYSQTSLTSSQIGIPTNTFAGVAIIPTYNQSGGTFGVTDLLINRKETSLSSGPQFLADFQVASSSKFNVTNTGNVGIGTTTPGSLLSIGGTGTGWNFYDNATTTKSGVGGVNILQGCFAVNGTCVGTASSFTGTLGLASGGTGTTTAPISQLLYGGATAYQSVATTTFTPGSEFTTTGTLGALIGGSNSTLALATNQTALSKLVQIAANTILGNQTGATGNVVALSTSTLSIGGTAGNVTGTVAIGNGGTNATSQVTNGVNYFDGSSITSNANFTFSTAAGGQFSLPSTGNLAFGGLLTGYASSTNGVTLFGLGTDGGGLATTSASAQNVTAIGYQALNVNAGSTNTAIGSSAAAGNTTGGSNTALGTNAQFRNQTGSFNTAIGVNAGNGGFGQSQSGGTYVGYLAGALVATNAGFNTFIGYGSGRLNSTGYGNTLIGANADVVTNLSTGGNNIGIGYNTLFPSATGNGQLNIGNFLFGTQPATTTAATFTLPTSGNFAIGATTSASSAKFTVATNNGDTATRLFSIASSTASATTTLFAVSNTGTTTLSGIGNSLLYTDTNSNILGTGFTGAANNGQILALSNGVPTWVATTTLANLTGTLAIAKGGTGTTTAPISQLLYGGASAYQSVATSSFAVGSEFSYSGTLGALVGGGGGSLSLATNQTALSKLVQVAANTILGNNTGVTGNVTAFATSTLGIALSDTTGTLGVSRGGTGVATFTSSQVLYGNGTNALSSVATSSIASGTNITVTNGSTAYVLGAQPTISLSGTIAYGNGGTGTTTAPISQLLYGGANAYQSVATSSVSNGTGISVSGGGAVIGAGGLTITNTGVTSIGPAGQTLTGAVAIASSTASFNGLTLGLQTIGSGATLTNTPTITGTLGVGGGGTGQTSFAVDQLHYGAFNTVATTTFTPGSEFTTTGTLGALIGGSNSTLALATNQTALSKLVQVAGNTILGNNTGATGNITAFATSSLGIALSDTTGTLTVARGGTGVSTFTSGQILYGNGTNALTSVGTTSIASGTNITVTNGSSAFVLGAQPTISLSGTIAYGNGGTGTTTAPIGQLLYGGGTAYQSVATSSVTNGTGISFTGTPGALVGGTALTITNTGLLSLQQTGGGIAQTGAITFATSSQTTNGLLVGLNITNSTGAFTFSPTISGTLAIAGGGTNATSQTTNGVNYFDGTRITSGTAFNFNGTNLGIGSTTPGSLLSIGGAGTGWNFYDNATTTKSGVGGINILQGCFAVNGVCVGGGTSSFSNTIANGGTATTTFYDGGVLFYNASLGTLSQSSAQTGLFFDNTNQRLGIGTTTPVGPLTIQTLTNQASAFSLANSAGSTTLSADTLDTIGNIFSVATTSGADYLDVQASGNIAFGTSVYTSCTGLTTNAQGVIQCSVSDQHLKQNITTLDDSAGLSAIRALNPVSFTYIDPSRPQGLQYGVIAQQVQQVLPNLVASSSPTYLTPNGTLTVNYEGLIAPLIRAVQELDVRTSSLATSTATSTSSSATSTAPVSPIVITGGNVGVGVMPAAARLQIAGNILADEYDAPLTTATVFTYGSSTLAAIVPANVLTAGGTVDLYKLATYNLSGITLLASAMQADEMRITSLEDRVAALESGAVTAATSTNPFSTSTLASAFNAFGAYIAQGIAQFGSLVADQFVAATNSAGTSSAGSGTVLSGNTTVIVQNAYVHPSSKIFVTFTGAVTGGWYLSDKQEGSFRLTLPSATSTDSSFDYFIVQTVGQVATSTAPVYIPPPVVVPPPPVVTTPPPSSGSGSGTSTPPVASSTPPVVSSAPPTVTLNGSAAMQINQGDTFTDPGASALDYRGADISSSIAESGAVDATTAGSYTLTYTATDSVGNTGSASRLVNVLASVPPPPADDGSASSTPSGG